jgi:hypothetical protein
MSRQIIKTVFKFDELSEDAQDRAVGLIRERFAGPWWDSSDTDDIADAIHMAFAEALNTPGHDQYGEADFPGIPGVTLESWDVDHLTVAFCGSLDRDNAPGLPWVEAIMDISLTGGRRRGSIDLNIAESPSWGDEAACETLLDAVCDALDSAIRAGADAVDYKTGDEYCREWCKSNDEQEYEEDGTLA